MGRLLGLWVASALVACSSASGGSSSSGGGGQGMLACVPSGGCPTYHCGMTNLFCMTEPVLTCNANTQCMASEGSVCRDVSQCRWVCNVDRDFVCAYPTDGGSLPLYFPDGGPGCIDCTAVSAAYPLCVNGICQVCETDSDCTGTLHCSDASMHAACNTPADCPGAAGAYICE